MCCCNVWSVLFFSHCGFFGRNPPPTTFFYPVFSTSYGTAVLFIYNYSQVNVVTQSLSAASFSSNVDRPVRHQRILGEKGESVFIMRLQGFLLYGTAENLLSEIRARLFSTELPPLRFVILDWRRIIGIDQSAVNSLRRMRRLAREHHFALVFTDLSAGVRDQLHRGGMGDQEMNIFHIFGDLDHGLEWCEEETLKSEEDSSPDEQISMQEQLKMLWDGNPDLGGFLSFFERNEVPEQTELVKQGEPSDSLVFIESGEVSVLLELDTGRSVRLRRMGAGTVVGEVGFFQESLRTATVVTEKACVYYRLTNDGLKKLEEDPVMARSFHNLIIQIMSERLTKYNRTLQAILD